MNGAEFLDHVTDTLGLRALFGVEQVDMIHVQIPLGHVRMRVNGGPALLLKVTGRRSDESLYDFSLATYDTGDTFDQSLAKGFIEIWSLPSKISARRDLA